MNEGAGAPVESLNDALERIRLEGAIFMRCEFTERWALSDLGGPAFAAMMHPGAERLVLFHVVASGRCWVSAKGGERIWASAGEVIVLPYGDQFVVGGEEPVEPTSAMTVETGPSRCWKTSKKGKRWHAARPFSREASGASRCVVRCPSICRARRSCMIRVQSALAVAALASRGLARTSPRCWRRSPPA